MAKQKIIIEIRKGLFYNAISTTDNIEIHLVDHDNPEGLEAVEQDIEIASAAGIDEMIADPETFLSPSKS